MEDTSNRERNTKKKKSSSKSSNVVGECDGLPPPQSLPLPSVKSYTIPRRLTTNKELLTPATLNSREGKDIIKNFENSLWDADAVNFTFHNLYLVTNAKLEAEYAAKRKDMRKENRSVAETTDNYVFKHMRKMEECESICRHGLTIQKKNQKNVCSIGDGTCGVYVCRCADVITRKNRLYDYTSEVIVLVFKVMKGRLKVVQEQFNSDGIEPTPEYDGHISKSFQRGKKMNFGDMYDSSQMYLYEINLDNLDENDDTAIYSKRPRQCLPYAVITLTAKQKILKPVVKPSQPPSRPLMNIDLSSNSTDSIHPSPSQGTLELPPEEYGQRLCFVWGGSYYNSSRYFAEVQIGVFAKQPLHLPLHGMPNLCVTQKISQAKLMKIFPTKIFRTPPSISLKPEVVVKGFQFIHAEIHPSTKTWINMQRLRNNWLKNETAGVCTFNSGIKLYILPTCELTCTLGITVPGHQDVLHCIFMRKHSDKPTYGENCHKFIKRAQIALRERLQEAEEIKGLRVDASVRKLPKYPFNADEKRKLSMCITRLKREQEKQVKDLRKQMETNNSIGLQISQSEIVNTSRIKEKEASSVTIPSTSTTTTTTTSQPPASEDTEKEDNDIDFSSESVLELLKEAAPELIKPNICKVTSEDNATADDSDRLVVVSDSQETGEETDKVVQNSPDNNNDRSESLMHHKFDKSCNIPDARSNSEKTLNVVKMSTSDKKKNLLRKDVNKKTRDNEEIPFIGSSDVQSSGASLIVDTASQDEDLSTNDERDHENISYSDVSDDVMGKRITDSKNNEQSAPEGGETCYQMVSPAPAAPIDSAVLLNTPVLESDVSQSTSQSPCNFDALKNEMRKQGFAKEADTMTFQDISSGSDLGEMESALQATRTNEAQNMSKSRPPKMAYQVEHDKHTLRNDNVDNIRPKQLPKAYQAGFMANNRDFDSSCSSYSEHEGDWRHREPRRRYRDDRRRSRSPYKRGRSRSPRRRYHYSSYDRRHRSPSPRRMHRDGFSHRGRSTSPLFNPIDERHRSQARPQITHEITHKTPTDTPTHTMNDAKNKLELQSHSAVEAHEHEAHEHEKRPEEPFTESQARKKTVSRKSPPSGSTTIGYDAISSDESTNDSTDKLPTSSNQKETKGPQDEDGTLGLTKRAEILFSSLGSKHLSGDVSSTKHKGSANTLANYENDKVRADVGQDKTLATEDVVVTDSAAKASPLSDMDISPLGTPVKDKTESISTQQSVFAPVPPTMSFGNVPLPILTPTVPLLFPNAIYQPYQRPVRFIATLPTQYPLQYRPVNTSGQVVRTMLPSELTATSQFRPLNHELIQKESTHSQHPVYQKGPTSRSPNSTPTVDEEPLLTKTCDKPPSASAHENLPLPRSANTTPTLDEKPSETIPTFGQTLTPRLLLNSTPTFDEEPSINVTQTTENKIKRTPHVSQVDELPFRQAEHSKSSNSETVCTTDEKVLQTEGLVSSLKEWSNKLKHHSLDLFCENLIRSVSEEYE